MKQESEEWMWRAGLALMVSAAVSFAFLFLLEDLKYDWPWIVIVGGWLLTLIVQMLQTAYFTIRGLFAWRRYMRRFLLEVACALILTLPFIAICVAFQEMFAVSARGVC